MGDEPPVCAPGDQRMSGGARGAPRPRIARRPELAGDQQQPGPPTAAAAPRRRRAPARRRARQPARGPPRRLQWAVPPPRRTDIWSYSSPPVDVINSDNFLQFIYYMVCYSLLDFIDNNLCIQQILHVCHYIFYFKL